MTAHVDQLFQQWASHVFLLAAVTGFAAGLLFCLSWRAAGQAFDLLCDWQNERKYRRNVKRWEQSEAARALVLEQAAQDRAAFPPAHGEKMERMRVNLQHLAEVQQREREDEAMAQTEFDVGAEAEEARAEYDRFYTRVTP